MSAARTKPPVAGLLAPPQTDGPRVRVGVLWFFLALAAVTSGRWWTGALMALLAGLAAAQTVRAWALAFAGREPVEPGEVRSLSGAAAFGAAAVPLAAAWGTGAAGVVLAVVGIASGVGLVPRDRRGRPTLASVLPMATIAPAVAASSIVLAVRVDVWAGVALVVAVSLFDAGNFLLGAGASTRWEGPVAGIIGALAVVFTMSTLAVGGISTTEWWIAGSVMSITCVLGLPLVSLLLPSPEAWVPALRRLDSYLVAGPAFVGVLWAIGR